MKGIVSGIMFALLVLNTLALAYTVQQVKAETIIIVPDQYPTIQAAINAASLGDTVYVRAGTYYESVVINKSIALFGENPETTIIDRGDSIASAMVAPGHWYYHDSVVFIIADNVVVSGFTIQHSGSGRGVHPSGTALDVIIRNVTISRNFIKNVEEGIMITYAAEIMIINNTITTKHVGIYSDSSTGYIVINQNAIENNKYSGILSSHTGALIVGNNTMVNNGMGMSISGRQGGVGELVFSTYMGYPSYWIRELGGGGRVINTIYGNLIMNNEYGVYLSSAERANIFYNNNFFKNKKQVYVEDGTSWWDNGAQGNFWSDYDGTDPDGDGVGSPPYTIDANNRDIYPLIVPVFWDYSTPIPVVWQGALYPVALSSNSTISTFKFNQPQMRISFNLTGSSGIKGFCNVTISKSLLRGPWTFMIYGATTFDISEAENATHSFLHLTYTHESTLQVTIQGTWVIPEFSSVTILPLFMALTIISVVFTKKKLLRKLKT